MKNDEITKTGQNDQNEQDLSSTSNGNDTTPSSIDYSKRLVQNSISASKNILTTTALASLTGIATASITGRNKYATTFYMATTWTLAAIPFFTIRQSIITLSEPANSTLRQRERTNLIASGTSGFILGLGTGYYWRGPIASIPAALFQSFAALIGQTLFSSLDRYRIRESIKRLEHTSTEQHKIPILQRPLLRSDVNETYLPHRSQSDIDPMKTLFKVFQEVVVDMVFPGSPTYVVYATDLEYRRKLNLKIKILEDQVGELKDKLKNKGIPY